MSRRTSHHYLRFVAIAVLATSCNRLDVGGEIQKVRVYGNEESATAVIVDFRLVNRAQQPLVVSDVEVIAELADGRSVTGATVSDGDAERFLTFRPELGPKYNPTLTARTKFTSGQTQDFMVAASFEQGEDDIQGRKSLRVRVHDVDGQVFEIAR